MNGPQEGSSDFAWQALVRKEFDVRKRLFSGETKPSRDDLRGWWRTVAHVLKNYTVRVARGERPEPPPVELIGLLSNYADYLGQGTIPEPFLDAATEGRSPPGPDERRDIELAVAYRKACEPKGIEHNGRRIWIDDKHPIKTLSALFSADRRTVTEWVRSYRPVIPGVNSIDAETLKVLVGKAGKRYSQGGRTKKAIEKRQSKKADAGN